METPRFSCMMAASTRAGTSLNPPAAKGTTRVIGRLGYVCAWAVAAASPIAAPSNAAMLRFAIDPSSSCRRIMRSPAAQVERQGEIDSRCGDAVLDQDMLAKGVHGRAARVR